MHLSPAGSPLAPHIATRHFACSRTADRLTFPLSRPVGITRLP